LKSFGTNHNLKSFGTNDKLDMTVYHAYQS